MHEQQAERLAEVRHAALAALRPPPRLKLSEWIENTVKLPEGVSALPGDVRLWPYQPEIADAIGDPEIERVTLVKPVRVGFTTLLTGALASYVANDPAPILALLPTEADCRDYMVSDIEPIFEASPELAGLLGKATDEASRNTMLSRRFPGGSLKIVAAKAPRNLRRHNVRILLIDEADGMEATTEGSPIVLAERRTLSFADRKIVVGSTPVFEETSHVLRSYANSDARIYEVPCPECGDFHEIAWSDIRWPEGEPEKAFYACPGCGSVVDEKHKPAMVRAGRWRATQPHVHGHAGFRLNALVSLLANASWGRLAREFLQAKDDPGLLQVFTNTILAQGWREAGEELDDTELASRAKPFSLEALPAEVLAITVGIDVQRDRLEATFIGHGRDDDVYILGHRVIWGLYDDDALWTELDSVLKLRFDHPLGGKLGVAAAAIDSSDGVTMAAVYDFAFPRASRKILAIKGDEGRRPAIAKSSQKIRGGSLWIVGVDTLKGQLIARLTRSGGVHFSESLPAAWYEQLASERAIVRYHRGQPRRRFERIAGRRAEALDCTVYALAARHVINPNFDEIEDGLRRGVEPTPNLAPAVVKSSWMNRGS